MSDSQHHLLTIFRYRSSRSAIDDEALLRDGDQNVWSQVDAVTPRFSVPRFLVVRLIVQDSSAVAVRRVGGTHSRS